MKACDGWLPDTRIGLWFQSTSVWVDYVLHPAFDLLIEKLEAESSRFPTVLDAGCGFGQAFSLIDRQLRPDCLIGVDIDPAAAARAQASAALCAGSIDVRHGDVCKLDLPDESVDLVFCHQTLHHVRDPAAALGEFRRVLRRGGVLLAAESCRCFIRSLPVRLLFRHPMEVQNSAEEWLKVFSTAGFSFEDSDVVTSSPFWSRPDFGLFGASTRGEEPSQVHVAARRPVG